MGRASRLARRPGPIDNRGDLDRVEVAIGTLLERLKPDPRVNALYPVWCQGRELPRLMTVPVSDEHPDLKAAAWADLMTAVTRAPTDREHVLVLQTLADIAPSRRWPRRAAATALECRVWPSSFYTAIQRPDLTQALWVTVRDDGAVRLTYGPDRPPIGGRWVMTRRGHRPQQTGHATIRAAVETWWQAYGQPDPVPLPALYKKYAVEAGRVTDAHSVVDDRLELAETLLNQWLEV